MSSQTDFNGVKRLDGSFNAQAFQVGADAGQTIAINSIVDSRTTALGNNTLAADGTVTAAQLLGSGGLLPTRTQGLRDNIQRNKTEQQRREARVEATKVRLTRQYAALDTTVSRISGTGSSLTQSLAAPAVLTNGIASGKGTRRARTRTFAQGVAGIRRTVCETCGNQ